MPNQDMLINYVPGEECRIAITENDRLEELYTERTSADLHVSNIYRGRVTNVESSIQAAFVDFGLERSGFLHITDLHPRYFPGKQQEDTEKVGHKTPRRERPPIQKCLRRGQEIIVQVLKEGIGSKGPTVTSYLSIPGRFLVMMPWMERHGVSRKIDDPDKRKQVRKILDELDPPDGMGFIVRTAGLERNKTELKRDFNFLMRLWKDIDSRMKKGKGPTELYTESDLIIRTLRDVMTSDVKRVMVDNRDAALRAKQFLRIAMPRTSTKVIHHGGPVPLFDAFGIEQQIQQINERQVPLKCGGSLVFDQTEALVAVDVNSGKFRDAKDSEDSAYRTNLEAVEEIARQLRLRDLGGLLVLDLIDMYVHRHRREVERKFREAMKKDRARSKVLKISDLGMLEMTRQRMRPSLKKSVFNECPTCTGTGQVLSPESVVLQVMRRLAVALSNKKVTRAKLLASPDVVTELSNRKRDALVALEQRSGKAIKVEIDPAAGPDTVQMLCFDANDEQVDVEKLPKPNKPSFGKKDEITPEDVKAYEQSQPGPSIAADEPSPDEEDSSDASGEDQPPKKKRRRRRRGGRRRKSKGGDGDSSGSGSGGGSGGDDNKPHKPEPKDQSKDKQDKSKDDGGPSGKPVSGGYEGTSDSSKDASKQDDADSADDSDQPPKKKRRRRRGGRRHRRKSSDDGAKGEDQSGHDNQSSKDDGQKNEDASGQSGDEQKSSDESDKPKKKRRRRRSSKPKPTEAGDDTPSAQQHEQPAGEDSGS